MKSLIKPAVLIVLCGLLFFLGIKLLLTQEVKQIKPTRTTRTQDTTLRVGSDSLKTQETYVSKVLISAPWGEKNEEFGHYVSGEEGFIGGGPNTFAVAPNGDIYINDPLNNRIQRFSSEGSFVSAIPTIPGESNPVDICIDQNNNIYFLRYGWKPEELGDSSGVNPFCWTG